jgi:hypothetical protein
MEQDAFKSAWQGMDANRKTNKELSSMMQESAHPVLKRIRKQLILETVSFTAFLLVYYNAFDGDRKPFSANMLLVMAMLFVIAHNIMGYILTRRPVNGNTVKQSLNKQLLKLKTYAAVSVASRVLSAACLLLFFTSVITFTTNKYWMLAAIILLFVIQIIVLSGIWIKRVRQMKETINSF